MKHYLSAALFAVVFATFGMPANAQTPDGQTPAEESVCDVLSDATPGLQGLCNAFCEAQDADIGYISGDILAKASHARLLANYNKKKQAGDPDMPCLRSACPCFDSQDIVDIGAEFKLAICVYSESGTGSGFYRNTKVKEKLCNSEASITENKDGTYSCFYADQVPGTDPRTCVVRRTATVDDLTAEQAAACHQAIADGAAALGVQCKVRL